MVADGDGEPVKTGDGGGRNDQSEMAAAADGGGIWRLDRQNSGVVYQSAAGYLAFHCRGGGISCCLPQLSGIFCLPEHAARALLYIFPMDFCTFLPYITFFYLPPPASSRTLPDAACTHATLYRTGVASWLNRGRRNVKAGENIGGDAVATVACWRAQTAGEEGRAC